MTDTSKREDMIEEAAKAIHGVAMQEYPAMEEWRFGWMQQKDRDRNAYLREAEAALAVFEKACTPTEDEREALAVLISVYINETDDSGDLPKARGLAEQILAGFRRTAAQEPSARMIDTYDDDALRTAFGLPEPSAEPSAKFIPGSNGAITVPNGEPSDAEVREEVARREECAEAHGYPAFQDEGSAFIDGAEWMRAALRAAYETRGEGR